MGRHIARHKMNLEAELEEICRIRTRNLMDHYIRDRINCRFGICYLAGSMFLYSISKGNGSFKTMLIVLRLYKLFVCKECLGHKFVGILTSLH